MPWLILGINFYPPPLSRREKINELGVGPFFQLFLGKEDSSIPSFPISIGESKRNVPHNLGTPFLPSPSRSFVSLFSSLMEVRRRIRGEDNGVKPFPLSSLYCGHTERSRLPPCGPPPPFPEVIIVRKHPQSSPFS